MAKAPTAPKPARASTTRPAAASPAAAAPVATNDAIRMLVSQEGPEVSRSRGDELTIGTDVDVEEAQRLLDADFAERV